MFMQPLNLLLKDAKPSKTQITTYNQAMYMAINNFTSTHPQIATRTFDTYGFLSKVLEDPGHYGIKNTTGWCADYDAPDIASECFPAGMTDAWSRS